MRLTLALGALLCLVACDDPARLEGTEAGDCTDGVDNDGDGATDCEDSGCGAACADSGPVDGGGEGDDAGPSDGGPVDAGSPGLSCGDLDVTAIDDTTTVPVDTRTQTNDVATCGGTTSPGHEAFVALALTAGDRWHFHASPDPSVPQTDARDPFVYLLDSTCETSSCDVSSEQCTGPGDEHFTYDVPATGRYYLGVDDRNAEGGAYMLDAVRIVCGNGVAEHGEACDGSANCSSACRVILEDVVPSPESIPNDNMMEANEVPGIESGGTFTITGNLGGGQCTYPDFFTFTVDEGVSLSVQTQANSGAACASAAETPFEFTLLDASGNEHTAGGADAAGCANLTATGLAAGSYFLRVGQEAPDTVVAYRFEVEVTP